MADNHIPIPVAEIARRGKEIYEQQVRPVVEADNRGKVVAIDIHSEDYELGENVIGATELLKRRQPNAEIWLVRVSYPSLYKTGYLRQRPISDAERREIVLRY